MQIKSGNEDRWIIVMCQAKTVENSARAEERTLSGHSARLDVRMGKGCGDEQNTGANRSDGLTGTIGLGRTIAVVGNHR